MGAERDPRAASIDEALRAWRQGDCVLDDADPAVVAQAVIDALKAVIDEERDTIEGHLDPFV